MRTTVYTRFDELPHHCLQLLDDVEQSSFFYGGHWFKNFSSNTVDPSARIRIYVVEDDNANPNARGILFMRAPAGQAGSFSSKMFTGKNTVASMTAHQSLFFSPAIRDSDEQFEQIIKSLVKCVCNDTPTWGVIDLNFLDPTSRVYKSLARALNECNLVVRQYEYRPNVYENVSGISYAEYMQSRSRAVKKTYQYKARKLEKSSNIRFEVVQNSDNIEQAIQNYEHVLENSWKEPEPFPNHAAGLIRAAAEAGTLRLGFLFLDDEPVATHLWIISAGKATICKHHHNLKFKKESVGAVLTLRMFEYAIDTEHVDEIDFGVGDEPAKFYWLKEERPLCGIVAFNPRTLTGLIALLRFSTAEFTHGAKQELKPILGPLMQRLSHATSGE